jgi:hypothetical protein
MIPLPWAPLAQHLDAARSELVLAGLDRERTVLLRIDPATGAESLLRLDVKLVAPTLAAAGDGAIVLADGATNEVYQIPFTAWPPLREGDAGPAAGTVLSPSFAYENRGGIDDVAVTKDGRTIFVADVGNMRVSALRPSGKVTDMITGYAPRKNDIAGLPLVMLLRASPIEKGDAPSLLLGNHQTEILTVADFQPDLESFAVAAVAAVALPPEPRTALQAGPVEGSRNSPLLLASDERQSLIAVGSRLSRHVAFFSRGAATLERLGDIDLATPPLGLAIAADGRTVVAIHAGMPLATTIRFGDPGALEARTSSGGMEATSAAPTSRRSYRRASSATQQNAPNLVLQAGSAKIRDLQRRLAELGVSVGAVDGFPGRQTEQALKTLNADRGLALDLRDIDGALETLRALP